MRATPETVSENYFRIMSGNFRTIMEWTGSARVSLLTRNKSKNHASDIGNSIGELLPVMKATSGWCRNDSEVLGYPC